MKKFWHISSVDTCVIFYGTYEEVKKEIWNGNEYGPFDTLTACKKDAIEYHQCTINYARMAINDIKQTKLKDLKNEKYKRND